MRIPMSYPGLSMLLATMLSLGACANSADSEDDDDDGATDADTDGDTDGDADTDADADADADADTDTDADTDSDTDSSTEGYDCATAIEIADEPALFLFSDNWSHFQGDSFDSTMSGCSDSGGHSAWFLLTVPGEEYLKVEKTNGATVGINVVDACDATSCIASGANKLTWFNESTSPREVYVVVESDFAISQGAMDFTFDRYVKQGETCESGHLMSGPYPQTVVLDGNEYEVDPMPTGCGSGYTTDAADVWFRIPVPAATQLTFTASSAGYYGWYYGYSLDCASCVSNTYAYSPASFEYKNTSGSTEYVYAFIQDDYGYDDWKMLGGPYTGTAAMTPLPAGDACAVAIDIDETALPHTWTSTNPLFVHSCPAGICPGTSGPDVWHAIDVPAGQVLKVTKNAGPAAFFAAVSSCTASSALYFSTNPQVLVWQNATASTQTLYVVAGAVSSSSISTLSITFDIQTPAPGDFCGSAIPVAANDTTPKTGNWADFGDYFWGGPGCGAASGKDVWYAVEVPSGEKLLITETSATDTTIQVKASCTSGSCVVSGLSEVAHYINTTYDDQVVYVAIEAALANPPQAGYSVTFGWEVPPEGDLCVNPIPIGGAVETWTGSWSVFMNSSTFQAQNGCWPAAGRDAWFDVEVPAGERLTIYQDSSIPAAVHVVDDCGDEATCSSSGVDEADWYNTGASLAAARVGVEALSAAVVGGPIELEFVREPIGEGDACSTAFEVAPGDLPFEASADLWEYGTAWPGNTGCIAAGGSDVWWTVDVPPDQVVFFEETSSTDTTLYLALDCPLTSCVVGADEPEKVNWYNSGTATVTVFAVARATSAADNGAVIDVALDVGNASPGDFCSNAIVVGSTSLPFTWAGNLTSFTDGFTGQATGGCIPVTGGAEVWFQVPVPAGHWLTAKNNSSTATAIQVLGSCATQTCLEASNGTIFWQNEGSATTVYVAVEGVGVLSGTLDVEIDVLDVPPTLFGPDAYGYWGATDDDVSVCPDISSTGTLLSMWYGENVSVNLGGSFAFYGQSYSSAYVAWDGVIGFGSPVEYSGGWLPIPTGDSYVAMPLIAPYWSYMDPEAPGAAGIYHHSWTEGSKSFFGVQWKIPAEWGLTNYDIRMVLELGSGMIHFCYLDTTTGSTYYDYGVYAASGIQQSSTAGLQYSYDQPVLTEGLHVWIVSPD
ncbi:MAG TPA: hypothetical protein VM285_06170 [Polyangia bacterium]|nr:hypothetical protein [Polyangia bacterium]